MAQVRQLLLQVSEQHLISSHLNSTDTMGLSSTNLLFSFTHSTVYDPKADPELLKLDTDLCLFGDEKFRPFAVKVRGVGNICLFCYVAFQ